MRTIFDTRALTTHPDRAQVKAFRAAMTRTGDPRWRDRSWLRIAAIVISALVIPFTVTLFAVIWFDIPLPWSGGVAVVTFLISIGFAIYQAQRNSPLSTWADHLRCYNFARANAMAYAPQSKALNYPGLIFGIGHDREAMAHIYSNSGPIADCGTHAYVIGSGKNRSTYRWQYAAIRLPAPLPHMLLDAKANNGFGTNLPAALGRTQRLSVGGELERHFALYCPADYGFDAYYIFTPDVLAQLIDHAHAFDVEIVDNWMFLYTRYDLPVTDPDTWRRLAAIHDLVAQRIRDRARSYRDHRLSSAQPMPVPSRPQMAGIGAMSAPPGLVGPTGPPPSVAPQGRRLRFRGRRLGFIGSVPIFLIWFFREPIGAFMAALFR